LRPDADARSGCDAPPARPQPRADLGRRRPRGTRRLWRRLQVAGPRHVPGRPPQRDDPLPPRRALHGDGLARRLAAGVEDVQAARTAPLGGTAGQGGADLVEDLERAVEVLALVG